jgi:hypothetical protein
MDFPSPPPAPPTPDRRRIAAWAAVAALALYSVLLVREVGAVAGGSDSSGYMNHARLLASGHLHVQPRIVEGLPQSAAPSFLYVPLGFKPAWDGNGLVPTYPTGFALFIVLLKPIAGWRHAGDLAIILHSLAGLVATYFLSLRLGLSWRWAGLAAAAIALSPLYLFMSLQAMSDVPSLAWTTFAILAALKSRERASWALAAGAAIAIDVLLRPTNVLAFMPVAIALGLSPRRWLLFVAGGLPGAVFLGVHSLLAYGSLATTGYGDHTQEFSEGYVHGTLIHYALWLPVLFTPIVVLDLGIPWLARVPSRTRWILVTWILAYAAFYSTYKCTHETWWYLRFLLPAAPALVIGGLLAARAVVSRMSAWFDPGRSATALVVALLLVASSSLWRGREVDALSIGTNELRYGRVADWMETHVPKDAVCLTMQASGALFYYTKFTFLRWDALDRNNVAAVAAAVRNSKRPLYAVLFPFEVDSQVLEKTLPGHWREVGLVDDVTIWRSDPASTQP